MADGLCRKPSSLHCKKSCIITVNYVLLLGIAVTVLSLNAKWYVLFTSDERAHKSVPGSRLQNVKIASIDLHTPPKLNKADRRERSDIFERRRRNWTDLGVSRDSVSNLQRARLKHRDDVINKSGSALMNDIIVDTPRKSNVSSNSNRSGFVCPIFSNLDRIKLPLPDFFNKSAELCQYYLELSKMSSFVPRNAVASVCQFLRSRSSKELELFENELEKFEKKFGVTVTNCSTTVRYLFSLKVLSDLGYDQKLPSALIIGSKKAGTTALRFTLNLHPQVNVPKQELEFFSRPTEYMKGLDYYRSNLDFCRKSEINVEKSPGYFHTESVPQRIKESLGGKIKLILCVRDPVRRTISDFHHVSYKHMKITEMLLQTKDTEGERFKREVLDDIGRLRRNQTIITQSLYSRHLRNWLRYFTLDDFMILREEDIRRNLPRVMAEVEQFLNVEPFFKSEMFTYKVRSCVRLTDGMHCAPCWGFELPKPRVNESVVRALRDYFRPFNREFENMTNESFSWTNL